MISLHNIGELVKEPFVNLCESVNLIDRVTGSHCLGNHEYTLVGRLLERLVYIGHLKFLVADESVSALAYHPESLLNRLLERAADRHNLADALHARADLP